MRLNPGRKSAGLGQGGYTLIELLVALAILCFLILLVPRLTPSARQDLAAKSAASRLAVDLRTARGVALSSAHDTKIVFNPQTRTYKLEPRGLSRKLPDGVSLAIRGPIDQRPDRPFVVWFFPDGSSSGGVFQVNSESGARRTIILRSLSGRVTQE